jgi:hypothetical protein
MQDCHFLQNGISTVFYKTVLAALYKLLVGLEDAE